MEDIISRLGQLSVQIQQLTVEASDIQFDSFTQQRANMKLRLADKALEQLCLTIDELSCSPSKTMQSRPSTGKTKTEAAVVNQHTSVNGLNGSCDNGGRQQQKESVQSASSMKETCLEADLLKYLNGCGSVAATSSSSSLAAAKDSTVVSYDKNNVSLQMNNIHLPPALHIDRASRANITTKIGNATVAPQMPQEKLADNIEQINDSVIPAGVGTKVVNDNSAHNNNNEFDAGIQDFMHLMNGGNSSISSTKTKLSDGLHEIDFSSHQAGFVPKSDKHFAPSMHAKPVTEASCERHQSNRVEPGLMHVQASQQLLRHSSDPFYDNLQPTSAPNTHTMNSSYSNRFSPSRKLVVSGLPVHCQIDTLRELLETEIGPVQAIMPTASNKPGIFFVTFVDATTAQKAVQRAASADEEPILFSKHKLRFNYFDPAYKRTSNGYSSKVDNYAGPLPADGRAPISKADISKKKIALAPASTGNSNRSASDSVAEKCRIAVELNTLRLFVDHLAPNTNSYDLKNYFSNFGGVQNAHVYLDGTGHRKTCGEVVMKSTAEVVKILRHKSPHMLRSAELMVDVYGIKLPKATGDQQKKFEAGKSNAIAHPNLHSQATTVSHASPPFTLFLSRIPCHLSYEDIQTLLVAEGGRLDVLRVQPDKFGNSHGNGGFAFTKFANPIAEQKLLDEGYIVYGDELIVVKPYDINSGRFNRA